MKVSVNKPLTVLNLMGDSDQLNFDDLIEMLSPLLDTKHTTGVEVLLTPAQYSYLACDEAAMRRNAAKATCLPLSRGFTFETGLGTVRIRRVSPEDRVSIEGVFS